MADNFTRKTIQETNVVPNLNFYELGDIILFKNGAVNFVTLVDGKKGLVTAGADPTLSETIKQLTTTVADHETRINALETPAG